MKKDKPIILVDPFPRTMDILFSKENLKYLNNNFKLLNAPKKNKINFYKKNLPNALYIFGQPDLPTELLKTQTILKAIFNVESNFMNNMDYEYCFKNNIHVLATSPVFAQPVAEMALGLTLSIARSIHIAHNDFIKGREKYGGAISKNNFLLKNKTFGFIGFGDLAKATLPLIRVFSNNILAYDPWISDSVIESKKVIPTSLNNIFKKSDIVYVYATSTTTNKEMIKLKNLNLFKDSSIILIMSRASVINFDDLYRFLKDRNVYAAIAVFPNEPCPKTDPFRKLKNVIFSPHRAGALDVAFKNMGEIVMKDIKLISRNLKPKNCKKAELKTVKKIISAPVKIN
jgi:phosphoglycerate dehydrogenase-like enzyme